MKKTYLCIFLISSVLVLYSQEGKKNLIADAALKLDSIIEYKWDGLETKWIKKSIINYNSKYDTGLVNEVTTLDYNTKIPVSQTIYSYTSRGALGEALYKKWGTGIWINTRRDLWFNNSDGLPVEAIIQYPAGNSWGNRIRYTNYIYTGHQVVQYTYQTSKNGNWVNYLYDYYFYDKDGNLVQRDETLVNGTPLNRFVYNLGVNNKWRELLLYNWINNKWVENYRRLYEYSQCGDISAVTYQLFVNGTWINSSRQEYYYTLNKDKLIRGMRIPICHKGHTIYVSINAIDAHLAHRDCIGDCLNKDSSHGDKDKIEEIEIKKPPFILYPNPATEQITIKFEEDVDNGKNNETKRVELTDFYGKLIRTFNIKGNNEFVINRDGLLSGKYYIRLVGKEVYSVVVIFE